jgi:diguanylate cyclase (GGDEF)-like protein
LSTKLFAAAASYWQREQTYLQAKQAEIAQHNRVMLRRMLPFYMALLILWRAIGNGTLLQNHILDIAILVHAIFWAVMAAFPAFWHSGRRLSAVLALFGAELLVTLSLLDTVGNASQPALLFVLVLVLMPQIYLLPPRQIGLAVALSAGGFLALSGFFKSAALFRRDVLSTLAALTLAAVCYFSSNDSRLVSYEEEKRLHYLCIHDPLTGVFNVSAFEQAYHARFHNQPHLFAILDMDHFKQINDSKGHGMGDSVLMVFSAAVAEQLKAQFPQSLVGRFGGDEFLIAASGYTDLADVTNRLEAMQAAVCQRMQNSFSSPITFSMGVVLCQEHISFREVFGRADREMYRAKESGRACGRDDDRVPGEMRVAFAEAPL